MQKRVIWNVVACGLLSLLVAQASHADDAQQMDVSGVWKWSQKRPDGDEVALTLTLKQSGETVTGTYHGRGPDSEITDGRAKDGELTFRVVREVEGHKITLHYSGKVDGNSVKGQVEMKAAFHDRKEAWEATRDKSQ